MNLTKKQVQETIYDACQLIDEGSNNFSCCAISQARFKVTGFYDMDEILREKYEKFIGSTYTHVAFPYPYENSNARVMALLMFLEVYDEFED